MKPNPRALVFALALAGFAMTAAAQTSPAAPGVEKSHSHAQCKDAKVCPLCQHDHSMDKDSKCEHVADANQAPNHRKQKCSCQEKAKTEQAPAAK